MVTRGRGITTTLIQISEMASGGRGKVMVIMKGGREDYIAWCQGDHHIKVCYEGDNTHCYYTKLPMRFVEVIKMT